MKTSKLKTQAGQAVIESIFAASLFISATVALLMGAVLVENGLVSRYRLYEATVCTQYYNEDPDSQIVNCQRRAEQDLRRLVLISQVQSVQLSTQQNRAIASVLLKMPWKKTWNIEESITIPLPFERSL